MENNILMNNMLEKYYFSAYREGKKRLNLFLLGSCNNNCKYCYLKKHQNQLFPKHLESYDTIFNNLQILLNWYIKNKFTAEIDLFSGEWLTNEIFYSKIFKIFFETFSAVSPTQRPASILIPDNMQFILNDTHVTNIQKFIDDMKSIGIKVVISASIDGKIIENHRKDFPTDEYYDKIFKFLTYNSYFCHPMISAENVSKWAENYYWWKNNAPSQIWDFFGMLEVRDNNWTEESINHYLKFLNIVIEENFQNKFKNNKINMLKYVLHQTTKGNQSIFSFPITTYKNKSGGCSYISALTIRVADLTLAPCHRLFYPELIIGNFKIENNEIIDFNVKCPELFIIKEHSDKTCLPHCENCQFVNICPGHCFGAAYENCDNPLVPPKTVCDLFIAKYTFLIIKYEQLGLWEYLDNVLNPGSYESLYLKKLINNVLTSAINKGIYVPKGD